MAQRICSVSQVNAYIKSALERDSILRGLCVEGEISNYKPHPSGHLYFTLKDRGSQLACVMWKSSSATGLRFPLLEGMKVQVTGDIQVYEYGGTYQLTARRIQMAGVGALYEEFEALKRKLLAEGLFDPAHKKPIPAYPTRIGIVTAISGAALQDVLNIARRRNPYVQLVLSPAPVQGAGAAEEIIRAIYRLCEAEAELILVVRGGGSIEDLWEFNRESLARAVYDCPIPIISGVGHETDTTIIDYVSDLRAPTPSAAAELAVRESAELDCFLVDAHELLLGGVLDRIGKARLEVEQFRALLQYQSPKERLKRMRLECSQCAERLQKEMAGQLDRKRAQLALLRERLRGLSPLRKIGRGYGFVMDANGNPVAGISDLAEGDTMQVMLPDGSIRAVVVATTPLEPSIGE